MTEDIFSAPTEAVPVRPPVELEVRDASVVYSRTVRAIDKLSFSVGTGEIVALLGPNGAGKSTTLRMLAGFLPGDRAQVVEGDVRFRGESLVNIAPHRASRLGVGMIAERHKVFATLTVQENLRIGARVNPDRSDAARMQDFVRDLFPILAKRERQIAGFLSGGERQMLAIATAMLGRPKLLMIDELSLGLAPRIVEELCQVLTAINREQKMTILLVEQSATVAFSIASYIYALSVGRVSMEGDAMTLQARNDFASSYLGVAKARASS